VGLCSRQSNSHRTLQDPCPAEPSPGSMIVASVQMKTASDTQQQQPSSPPQAMLITRETNGTNENGVNDLDDNIDLENIFNDIENDGWQGSNAEDLETIDERWIGLIHSEDYRARLPPSIDKAHAAKEELKKLLFPSRNSGPGHKHAKLDVFLSHRLQLMRSLLSIYTDPIYGKGWTEASTGAIQIFDMAHRARTSAHWASRQLRKWTKDFVGDHSILPITYYGSGNKSLIEDKDLKHDLLSYLQEIGKYVWAMDVVNYMNMEEVKIAYGLQTGISLATAKRWMHHLGYRWGKTPTGQYVDGHEREDVVKYRSDVFIPAWLQLQERMCAWEGENLTIDHTLESGRRVVVWHHDESIFYSNDRRKVRWAHSSEKAVPYTKGEGASLMVADFVSSDYGWLCSPDGKDRARVLFKPGKNRDGYFNCDDIVQQAGTAMDILQRHFPNEDHVFIFDNATTHTKCAEDALSARKMPKHPPSQGKNWGISITE
jgi:hypothetical protein